MSTDDDEFVNSENTYQYIKGSERVIPLGSQGKNLKLIIKANTKIK